LNSIAEYAWNGGSLHQAIVECDFKRFDSTVTNLKLKLLEWVYEKFGAGKIDVQNGTVLSYIRANRKTWGVTRCGVVYSNPDGRQSGDPFTSVGNSILNGLVQLYCMSMSSSCSMKDVKLMVCGDDAWLNSPNLDSVKFSLVAAQLGFQPKVIVRQTIEDSTFCSMRFWPCQVDGKDTYMMGPKINRWLVRAGWNVNSSGPVPPMLRSTMMGVVRDFNHVPFVSQYGRRALELLGNTRASKQVDDHRIHADRVGVPNHATMAMLFKIYGVGDLELDDFERKLSKVDSLTVNINLPYFEHCANDD